MPNMLTKISNVFNIYFDNSPIDMEAKPGFAEGVINYTLPAIDKKLDRDAMILWSGLL